MKLFSGNGADALSMKSMSPEDKKEFTLVVVAFICFAALAVFSMMNFVWLNNMSGEEAVGDIPMPTLSEAGAGTNANDLGVKYDDYVKYRTYSGQMVTLASAVGRYPVADAASTLVVEAPASEVIPAEAPPMFTIKALVMMGGDGAATVDIDGERPGTIIRSGYAFGGNKGRVTSIDAGGVNWTWLGKKYRTNL